MARINQIINKALTNKYVLYVVTFLAVTNILGYLAVQNTTSVIFFILLAFLTQYFSKNMTVILLTAMVGTSLLFVTHNYGGVREGMTAKEKADKDAEENQKRQKTLEMSEQEEKADSGEDDEVEGFSESQRIDRRKTNKQAFESIQSQLGPEGVKGLQADTKALMNQQKELMETMKSLEPMMDTAQGMLKSLDMGTLNKMTDLVGGLGLGKK